MGIDYKSQGEALVYLTPTTIDFQCWRTGLQSYKSVQDGDYFYSRKKKVAGVRVGFEGDNLSYFFSVNTDAYSEWWITLAEKAQKEPVAATPFSQMTRGRLLVFVKRVLENSSAGRLGDFKIKRLDNVIIVSADVEQAGENEDEPEKAGTAVITFVDGKNSRSIHLRASVEDRE